MLTNSNKIWWYKFSTMPYQSSSDPLRLAFSKDKVFCFYFRNINISQQYQGILGLSLIYALKAVIINSHRILGSKKFYLQKHMTDCISFIFIFSVTRVEKFINCEGRKIIIVQLIEKKTPHPFPMIAETILQSCDNVPTTAVTLRIKKTFLTLASYFKS